MELEKIEFYSANEAYGVFSNFALFPIKLKGKMWKTTEHYFQAQKFTDKEYQERIRKSATPIASCGIGKKSKNENLKKTGII